MKRLSLLLAAIMAFTVLAACSGQSWSNDTTAAPQSSYSGSNQQNSNSDVSACYRNSVHSFSDLDALAGYIVSAQVTDTEVIVGQAATMTVMQVYRGNVPDTIRLYQMPDDNGVEKDGIYLLFMGPQKREDPDSGDYYPFGAGVGVIRLDPLTKSMYVYNSCINDDDFAAWRFENGFGDWAVKGG